MRRESATAGGGEMRGGKAWLSASKTNLSLWQYTEDRGRTWLSRGCSIGRFITWFLVMLSVTNLGLHSSAVVMSGAGEQPQTVVLPNASSGQKNIF